MASKKRPGEYVGNAGPYPHEDWKVPGEVPPDKSARPLTDMSPGSAAYALPGPLGAKLAPERAPQGEGTGPAPSKTFGGSK
jgi:hypothetical protein